MTTVNWSTVIDHTSDAGFRAWGSEFNAKLTAAGLVNTADTGQINWTTVTRPGTSTNGGFEIWKLNDSLFGTAPVYFRFDYGTNTGANTPRIQVTMGTATNNSGTLSGTASIAAFTATQNTAPASTVVAYQSYICVKEGFFGLIWKVGAVAANSAYTHLMFARSADSSGTPTVTGAILFCYQSTSTLAKIQAMRFAATAAIYTAVANTSSLPIVIPGQPASSLDDSGNSQIWLWWMTTPTVRPVFGFATANAAEVVAATTMTVALVGSTARTYIGTYITGNVEASGASGYRMIMLWE
jgi:hypothetical protein